MSHLSGASSEPSSSLIQFSGSGTDKVDTGDGGGRAAPGSTFALYLSPYQLTPLHKGEVEDAGFQVGSKEQVRRWGEEEE